jgi:toxin ParE1/3/4
MSRRLVLGSHVTSDLEEIQTYLERDSLAVADRFVSAAFAAFQEIADMPGRGSPKQFRARRLTGLRSWPVPGFLNHLIFYRVTDEAVIIIGVVHGARDTERVLRTRV